MFAKVLAVTNVAVRTTEFERISPVRRPPKTSRWTKQIVLKRQYGITIPRCGKSQKSADAIYISAEACNHAAVSVGPSEYSAHLIIIDSKLINLAKFHRNDSRVRTTASQFTFGDTEH